MDEIILMRKLKRKDEWALGKIIDLYSLQILLERYAYSEISGTSILI